MNRPKQSAVITIVGGCHESQVNITSLEAIRNTRPAVFDQTDIHGGMPLAVGGQKIGKHRFHVLGAAADAQRTGPPGSQGARTLTEGLDVLQQPATAARQILAFGCQFEPAPDTIEQGNPKLGLESLDLAGRCRLTQVQAFMRKRKAPGFRNNDERMELSKIHLDAEN
jgi:hypothetical protein